MSLREDSSAVGGTSASSSEREERIDEALATYFAAVDAGQPPDRKEFLAGHPDIAADLEAFFADQKRVLNLGGRLGLLDPVKSLAPGKRASTPHSFGKYELLGEIAH